MNLILTLVSVAILAIFAFSQYLKYKRFKYSILLKSTYNKMEMYFTKEGVTINNNYLKLLKTFKDLSVNPEFLDIQVMIMSKIAAQKSGHLSKDTKWFESTIESLGDDFQQLFGEFDESANRLIMLSFWKPDFLGFAAKLLLMHAFRSGVVSVGRLMSEIAFIKKNDEAIYYSAKKLAI